MERQLVQLDSGELVFGPPKSKAGERTVALPATLVDVLGEHFATPPVQSSGLAFPGPKAAKLRRGNFRTVWRRACTSAGFDDGPLEGLTFHELRHTAAAMAITSGAHIKSRLGHSSITTTLDRYGHMFPSLDVAVADGLDELLKSSLTEPAVEVSEVVSLGR